MAEADTFALSQFTLLTHFMFKSQLISDHGDKFGVSWLSFRARNRVYTIKWGLKREGNI